jgi:hypothetical protein
MSKPKTIHRSVIKIEILHEDKVDMGEQSMQHILQEITFGDWSGVMNVTKSNEPLTGKAAADATKAQGSSPEFFQMDNDGNEIE